MKTPISMSKNSKNQCFKFTFSRPLYFVQILAILMALHDMSLYLEHHHNDTQFTPQDAEELFQNFIYPYRTHSVGHGDSRVGMEI